MQQPVLPGRCLHEIFEARVCEAPGRIAISTLDEQISYSDLDLRANQLAHRLQTLGVGEDVLVGLCIDRSIDMLVGLLAILKAGGAYVPIDPSYPSKRIHLLLDDSAVAVVVTVSRVAECLSNCNAILVCIDNDSSLLSKQPVTAPSAKSNDRSLAYAIYTSGSTGTPKGVLVEHSNVVRLFEQTHHWFGFNDQDVWTMFHSIGFDFSVWEIWGALLYGGHLVIVPFDVTRSPKKFYNLLKSKGVTILNQTPSAFRHLVEADIASKESTDLALRLVIFGGEALELKLLEPWIARHGDQRPELVNMYGITETTVHVTYRRITRQDLESSGLSPIGIPIPDLQVYLLDESDHLVPDGTPGNLYVAGPGLARGYLNRPELTAERFLRNPYSSVEGARLYCSGDRAVRMPNGDLVYQGRSDEQIKVRGFRIEPREIELCLCRHPQITSAIVIPHDYGDGDVRLIAYVVPSLEPDVAAPLSKDLSSSELTQHAAAELPVHMRPSAYVILSALPMTAHGKIARSALPLPVADKHVFRGESAASKTSIEQVVVKIWEDVLGLKNIGTDDDFFALGGTSLALIRIFKRVNEHFGLSLDVSVLIEGATSGRLARCVDDELRNGQLLETS
ncbi:amino acid adenylation domain-containing protein [Scytonema sp. HK-05]|uniref:amino acid adenylation domain-containing protein n=1 Tax=Scytonema sp. HK-05 TaxID=1137095 RepID=UPI001300D4CD|nr:amino acid adenylation domain-containing protein [Scytonema sp. HK-05]